MACHAPLISQVVYLAQVAATPDNDLAQVIYAVAALATAIGVILAAWWAWQAKRNSQPNGGASPHDDLVRRMEALEDGHAALKRGQRRMQRQIGATNRMIRKLFEWKELADAADTPEGAGSAR